MDLAIISLQHEMLVKDSHVRDLPSFSDHQIIRYKQRPRKLLRDIRKTNWHTYNEVLAKKKIKKIKLKRIRKSKTVQKGYPQGRG